MHDFGDTSEFGGDVVAIGSLVVTTTADTVDGTTTSVSNLIANSRGRRTHLAAGGDPGHERDRAARTRSGSGSRSPTRTTSTTVTTRSPASLTNVQATTLADQSTPSSPVDHGLRPRLPGGPGAELVPHPAHLCSADRHGPRGHRRHDAASLPRGSAGHRAGRDLRRRRRERAARSRRDRSTIRGLVVNGFRNDGITSQGARRVHRHRQLHRHRRQRDDRRGNGASGIVLTQLSGAPKHDRGQQRRRPKRHLGQRRRGIPDQERHRRLQLRPARQQRPVRSRATTSAPT